MNQGVLAIRKKIMATIGTKDKNQTANNPTDDRLLLSTCHLWEKSLNFSDFEFFS